MAKNDVVLQREHSIYLWAAGTQKHVDAFLRSEDGVTREEITNLRFHLSTMLVAAALGRRVDAKDRNAVQTSLGMDRIAKSSEFVEAMLVDHFPKRVCAW